MGRDGRLWRLTLAPILQEQHTEFGLAICTAIAVELAHLRWILVSRQCTSNASSSGMTRPLGSGASVRFVRPDDEALPTVRGAAEAQAAIAAAAAAEERAGMAGELHDLVAHSVSVMVVQASGVRRLLTPEQHREREALLSVEQIGRQALSELRRMLGVIRSGEERPAVTLAPQPGLDHLDRLIAQIEEAGLPVTLRVEGLRPTLSPGVDLSAYRIVQEGLTNALKHAQGAHAEVTVRYAAEGLDLEVADDGPGAPASAPAGHGLVGMRERVALYGGTLEAGPRAEGGFSLRVHLPAEGGGRA